MLPYVIKSSNTGQDPDIAILRIHIGSSNPAPNKDLDIISDVLNLKILAEFAPYGLSKVTLQKHVKYGLLLTLNTASAFRWETNMYSADVIISRETIV